MSSADKKTKAISRKDFIKIAAAGSTALASASLLTGCKEASSPGMPEKWDEEFDVVVVGYGGAGAAAAIAAHDAGAKVLILEKMTTGGGNTAVSGGGFLCPTNAKDAETYLTAIFDYCSSEIDKEMIKVFSEEAVKNTDWIKSLRAGTEVEVYGYAGYPELPGSDSAEKMHVVSPNGLTSASAALFDLLSYAVEEERGIEVYFETPAKRLVQNCEGEILGVIAEYQGKETAIKATRGVILTTGGHENDASLLKNHASGWPIHFLGNPGNTGDGTRMAQKVGADLWHMNGLSCPLGMYFPDFEASFFPYILGINYIYVDQFAKRFVNEKGVDIHAWITAVNFYDDEHLRYPRIPCYVIFDETCRLAGPLWVGVGYNNGRYNWSKDNSVELEKGWIVQGETIAELAEKLGLDAAELEATVAMWNSDVSQGHDPLFGRPVEVPEEERPTNIELAEDFVRAAPIETAPYYAVELYPTLLNTQGGPRRNINAQIVDPFGAPIPRLYSAGELGSMWGTIYQGASNIGECLVYGRIAGKNAAAEEPWA